MFWSIYTDLCLSIGETPNSVAMKIGISSGSVTKWKNGTVPSASSLIKIAKFFNVTVNFLLGTEKSVPAEFDKNAIHDLLWTFSEDEIDMLSSLSRDQAVKVVRLVQDLLSKQ